MEVSNRAADNSSQSTAAERLRRSKAEVLERWSELARQKLPAAHFQDKFALYNQLPEFLDEIIESLSKPDQDLSACKDGGVCREHGEQRANLSPYSLKQVILEYDLLRRTIFYVIEREGSMSLAERECILTSINIGISEAAGEYAKIQNSIREQFIAVLSHDLRNPLSAAKTSAQMIQRNPDRPEKTQSLASRIVDSINRADNMIRDLLDTFQVRGGQKLPISVDACELISIAKQTIEELSTIHGKRFLLETKEDEIRGYWSIEGIKRCIENLANNAVKYGDGFSPITIRLRSSESEIEIDVNNRGNPMVAEEQAKLFEPWHRSPLAKTSGKRGWGLGLTLVKGMVEAHGGSVKVESNEEAGTTFTLTLPRDARPMATK